MLASLCGPEYVLHTYVGGWVGGWVRGGIRQRRLALFCIYVLAVKLIQITIIMSGCDMPLIFSQLSFIHLSKSIPP